MLHSSSSLMRYVLHDFGPMSVEKNNFNKYALRFFYRFVEIFLLLQMFENMYYHYSDQKNLGSHVLRVIHTYCTKRM